MKRHPIYGIGLALLLWLVMALIGGIIYLTADRGRNSGALANVFIIVYLLFLAAAPLWPVMGVVAIWCAMTYGLLRWKLADPNNHVHVAIGFMALTAGLAVIWQLNFTGWQWVVDIGLFPPGPYDLM